MADRRRQAADDALGERLDLDQNERAGETKHEEGGEIAELQFPIAGDLVDLGKLGRHGSDEEGSDDIDKERDQRIKQRLIQPTHRVAACRVEQHAGNENRCGAEQHPQDHLGKDQNA